MRKSWLWLLLGGLLFMALLVQWGPAIQAGEEDLVQKVTQVLKNQEKILQTLQEIKEELVKIRIRTN